MVRRTCISYIYDLFFGFLHNSLFLGIGKIGYGDHLEVARHPTAVFLAQNQTRKKKRSKTKKKKKVTDRKKANYKGQSRKHKEKEDENQK